MYSRVNEKPCRHTVTAMRSSCGIKGEFNQNIKSSVETVISGCVYICVIELQCTVERFKSRYRHNRHTPK